MTKHTHTHTHTHTQCAHMYVLNIRTIVHSLTFNIRFFHRYFYVVDEDVLSGLAIQCKHIQIQLHKHINSVDFT